MNQHHLAVAVLIIASTLGLNQKQTLAGTPNSFEQENYVSDVPGLADHLDPNLVNPWGMAFSATSPFWIADQGTGLSTVYNSEGEPFPLANPLVVTVPPPAGGAGSSSPTGIVFNGGSGFETQSGQPSRFIFATQDGTISGWNPTAGNTAILKVDNSAAGSIYTGLAIGNSAGGQTLYAADFRNGNISSFNSDFSPGSLPGAFLDPNLPSGYAPFNVQDIAGNIYVSYALKNQAGDEEVAGPGNGFVNVFDPNGNLIRRLISQGQLNAPWGLTIADDDFGPFGNALLVGNFGDGRINAYNPATGDFLGTLHDTGGNPIEIDGLWALKFGNGQNAGNPDDLYFTAGIDDERHGLFGEIAAATPASGQVPDSSSTALLLGGALLALCAIHRRFMVIPTLSAGE